MVAPVFTDTSTSKFDGRIRTVRPAIRAAASPGLDISLIGLPDGNEFFIHGGWNEAILKASEPQRSVACAAGGGTTIATRGPGYSKNTSADDSAGGSYRAATGRAVTL
jgi:hypothetical protein